MDKAAKLLILKQDLQLLTTANDSLLENLLDLAAGAITREGDNPDRKRHRVRHGCDPIRRLSFPQEGGGRCGHAAVSPLAA